MHITLLIAGTNDPSNSAFLAQKFLEGIHESYRDTTVDTYYINRLVIDHFSLTHYQEDYIHEGDFVSIQESIQKSNGLVIATPVWNFGVPAHLKNLLDRMGSFGLDRETRSKGTLNGLPFYIIFTGGAPVPAWHGMMKNTTSFVREALRYFGGTPVGSYFEGKCTNGKGNFGLVVDKRPDSIASIYAEGKQFAEIVDKYSKTGALPIAQNLFGKVMKFGESVMKKVF